MSTEAGEVHTLIYIHRLRNTFLQGQGHIASRHKKDRRGGPFYNFRIPLKLELHFITHSQFH